jgi:hypothetical protein
MRWLRRLFCHHRVSTSAIRRVSPDCVEATCKACGKTLTAAYGIVLPARLEP